jgi:hypothetical protein
METAEMVMVDRLAMNYFILAIHHFSALGSEKGLTNPL